MFERFQKLFRYEAEANAKVIASLRSVPGANHRQPEYRRALGTFGHILAARQIWLFRLGGNVTSTTDLHPELRDAEHAADLALGLDAAWTDYTLHLTDARLRQVIDYTSTEGRRFRTRVEDILGHVLMHSAYHRGQIAMLVRQAGGEPAVTDYIFAVRETLD
ncbi:MAG: DinB family protein [Phycisphaeraceae bacterium]|nr:DinB family protein [Phycisphaeraceae bacterium]